MGATLRAQRLGALEATTLLRKVMRGDRRRDFRVRRRAAAASGEPAGERLIGQAAERLSDCRPTICGWPMPRRRSERTVQRDLRRRRRALGYRAHRMFREGGLPHQLLVVTDLTRPLREEELQAWQRLVRVLGHELNNSLTPIKSIAESLASISERDAARGRLGRDMLHGLGHHRVAQRKPQPVSRCLCAAREAAASRAAAVDVESLIAARR